jgi:hypothetical protein
MGSTESMECKDCGSEFFWSEGGGFTFHLLHCDRCGEERSVGFEQLGDAHVAWLKGTGTVWTVATAESDRAAADSYTGPVLGDEDYEAAVAATAGTCRCGGSFAWDVPPTCPTCRSRNVDHRPGGPMVCYD